MEWLLLLSVEYSDVSWIVQLIFDHKKLHANTSVKVNFSLSPVFIYVI